MSMQDEYEAEIGKRDTQIRQLQKEVERLKGLDRDNLARLESNAQQRDSALLQVSELVAAARHFNDCMDGCMYCDEHEKVLQKHITNETSTSEYSSARARLLRGECSRCGSPGCCECT